MNGLLVLFNRRAERYSVSTNIIRFWADTKFIPAEDGQHDIRSVILEFEDSEDSTASIISIKAGQNNEISNRVCESYLHHPGVIDLRGLNVDLADVEIN